MTNVGIIQLFRTTDAPIMIRIELPIPATASRVTPRAGSGIDIAEPAKRKRTRCR